MSFLKDEIKTRHESRTDSQTVKTTRERVIHTPKFEMNIKLDSESDLETDLPGKNLNQPRERLLGHLTNAVAAGEAGDNEEIPDGHNRFEILLHYLQTGTLSWHAANVTALDETAALIGICLHEFPRILEYVKTTREEAPFFFRLLQLLPKNECALLIQVLTEGPPPGHGAVVTQCLAMLLDEEPEEFSRLTRLSLSAGILAECAVWRVQTSPDSLR